MKRILSVITALFISIVCISSTVFAVSKITLSTKANHREGFVYADGTKFMLDGCYFYYAGTNNYYINFKPEEDIDSLMKDAQDMGLSVIRTWGFLDVGVDTGTIDSQTGYRVFTDNLEGSGEKEGIYYQYFDSSKNRPVVNEGETGLRKLDYAIYSAQQHGVKLLIPFVNNWEQFGGMAQYIKWASLAGENVEHHDDFYKNEVIKGWFKNYINTLLNHTNYYTGIKYKDDPTIFSWELANEPRCESDKSCENNVLYNWVDEMSKYVKSIDPDHMLAVGDEGFFNYGYHEFDKGEYKYVYYGSTGNDFEKMIQIPEIDFGTPHLYCDQWGLTDAQARFWMAYHYEICSKFNKPVVMEEFNWKERNGRAEILQGWYDLMEGNDPSYPGVDFAGTNFWMLASVMKAEGKLYQDYDGYNIYYRNETDGSINPTKASCDVVLAHAERMNLKNKVNSLSKEEFSFDIANQKDLTFNYTLRLGEFDSVLVNSNTLKKGTDYTITDSTITVNKSYLATLEEGYSTLKLKTTTGNQPTISLWIYDSSVTSAELSSYEESFSKDPASENYKDITVSFIGNGNSFIKIKRNNQALSSDYYSVNGNTVTIKKDYFLSQNEGTVNLIFDFSRGIDPVLKINVTNWKVKLEFESNSDFTFTGSQWEHEAYEYKEATCIRGRNNITATATITVPTDDTYVFLLRAGMNQGGTFQCPISIDGTSIGTYTVTGAQLNSYEIKTQLSAGTHTIVITLPDDYNTALDFLQVKTYDDPQNNIVDDIVTPPNPNPNPNPDPNPDPNPNPDPDPNPNPDPDPNPSPDPGYSGDDPVIQKKGDLNNDGILDISDVVLLRASIVENIKLKENQKKAADLNDDGEIDILDVVKLRYQIVNS